MRAKACALLIGLAISIAALAPRFSFAFTNEEIQGKVQEILMERHPTDTPDWWRALGSNAPGVLIAMFEKSSHTYHRIRILQGLGWFDSPEAVDFLKKQADAATDDVLRTTAIRSVGFSQGARAEDFVAKYLSHPDAQTRFTAAEVLKSFKDPRADAIVEKYLKEEKVPWIAGKLKGELPHPRGILTPVATSEDRLSAEFAGQWKGYWLAPRKSSQEGLRSDAATVNLKLERPTELRGEILLLRQGRGQTWKLERVAGKGTRISGVLLKIEGGALGGSKPSPSPQVSIPFEAELTQEAGSSLIKLHARKLGVTLVVRKNPKP